VPAQVVNGALRARLGALPGERLPLDDAVGSGEVVGALAFIAVTGDITNRAERGAPAAAESWALFRAQFLSSPTASDESAATPVYAVAGNHDVSNAIGYPVPLDPPTDATAMAALYNLAISPSIPRTAETFDYQRDRVRFTRSVGGVMFAFVNIWPDSAERVWLKQELARVADTTPVLLFAHSQPSADPRHFRGPEGTEGLHRFTQYQQLLSDRVAPDDTLAVSQQRDFTRFLKAHPNIVAYVHGHSNYSEFYDYTGPDADVRLPTFRVDSPMKGVVSGVDERALSFLLLSIDHERGLLTARECRWNATGSALGGPLVWGASRTMHLRP
jgi:hypothetical protein